MSHTVDKKFRNAVLTAVVWLFRLFGFLFFGLSIGMAFIGETGGQSTSSYSSGLLGTEEFTSYKYQILGEAAGPAVGALIFIVLGLLLFSASRRLNRRRPDRAEAATFDKSKPYILYLRTFIDDTITDKTTDPLLNPGKSEEDILVHALRPIAPVVTIGNPMDKYIPSGATRIYCSDDEWKDTVIDLMNNAELIFLRLGATQNFLWEVSTCLNNIDPAKIVFIIPALSSIESVEQLISKLNDADIHCERFAPQRMKKTKGSIAGFITIGDAKSPVFLKVRLKRFLSFFTSLEALYRYTLHDVLAGHSKRKIVKLPVKMLSVIMCAYMLLMPLLALANGALFYKNMLYDYFPDDIIEYCEEDDDIASILEGSTAKGKVYTLYKYFAIGNYYQDDDDYLSYMSLVSEVYGDNCSKKELTLLNTGEYDDECISQQVLFKKYLNNKQYRSYLRYFYDTVLLGIEQEDNYTGAGDMPPEGEAFGLVQTRADALSADIDMNDPLDMARVSLQIIDYCIELHDQGYDTADVLRYYKVLY